MKAILVVLLFFFTFGAGYYLGTSGAKEIKKNYSNLKEEMTVKTRGLEAEVSLMRVRLNLIEAHDFLGSARSAVKDKNFGEAEAKIDTAKERLAKAISLSPEARKKNLASIQSEIESIQEDTRRLNLKVGTRIEAVEKELEKITE